MSYPPNIPLILHQFWCNYEAEDVPPIDVMAVLSRTKTLFRDFEYHLWNRSAINVLIERKLPRYSQIYERVNIPAMKSDLSRLIALYIYGGVYLDATITPLRGESIGRLKALIDGSALVVAESRDDPNVILNSFISVEPNNVHISSVLKSCFRSVSQSMEAQDETIDVWKLTGKQLSNYIAGNESGIQSLNRLKFCTASKVFTRISCEYKEDDYRNWDQIQSGKFYPIYD